MKRDAGIFNEQEANSLLQLLIDQKLIIEANNILSLSASGEEAIAKIWSIHELVERLAFIDTSYEEKNLFIKVLQKIQNNCEKIIPYE